MCCANIIGKLLPDGRIAPLGNKVHILLEKQKPGLYIVNCCACCAREIDWKDQTVLDQVHAAVTGSWEWQYQLLGKPQAEIDALKAQWDSDKPQVGWYVIETNPVEREQNVAAYKKHAEQV